MSLPATPDVVRSIILTGAASGLQCGYHGGRVRVCVPCQVDAAVITVDFDPSILVSDQGLLGDSIDSVVTGGLTFSITSSTGQVVASVGTCHELVASAVLLVGHFRDCREPRSRVGSVGAL